MSCFFFFFYVNGQAKGGIKTIKKTNESRIGLHWFLLNMALSLKIDLPIRDVSRYMRVCAISGHPPLPRIFFYPIDGTVVCPKKLALPHHACSGGIWPMFSYSKR
jgi:hypothetical protein